MHLTCLAAAVNLVTTVCVSIYFCTRKRLTDTVAHICPSTRETRQVEGVGVTPRLLLTRQLTRLAVAISVTEVVVIRWMSEAWAVDLVLNHIIAVNAFPANC